MRMWVVMVKQEAYVLGSTHQIQLFSFCNVCEYANELIVVPRSAYSLWAMLFVSQNIVHMSFSTDFTTLNIWTLGETLCW